MQIKEIIKIVKGTYYNNPTKIKKRFHNIETDTRKLQKNDIFIALSGKKYDGHNFIEEAINRKVSLIIIEKNINIKKTNIPIIKVKNTQESLFDIAKYYLNKYKTPVIAITGSVGKTTTKELVANILEKKYSVLKSEGNKNNHIGVPQTIFQLKRKHDIIVLELGMNHEHEIEHLSKLVTPSIAIITNIGTSHIGNLGSIENIKKAKLEIIEGMQEGILLVNSEDNNLKNLKIKNNIGLLEIGKQNQDFSLLEYKTTLEGTEFILKHQDEYYQGNVKLYGEKTLMNLCLAIQLGLLLEVEIEDMIEAICDYSPIEQRMNIEKKDNYTIIDDCYNSSYESLIENIQFLSTLKEHKTLILADILELGSESKNIHTKIGLELKKLKNTDIILIGEEIKNTKNELKSARHFSNNKEAIQYLKEKEIPKDNIIYFKGSRKMKLEEIKKELFS